MEAGLEFVAEAIQEATGFPAQPVQTGGHVYVVTVELDERGTGRQIWVSFDDPTWDIGFYDFTEDPEDEGVVLQTFLGEDASPQNIAWTVRAILDRLVSHDA